MTKKRKRGLRVSPNWGGERSFWKVLFLLIVILVSFGFVEGVDATPGIEFVDPTPSDGTNTTNTSIEINVSITESDLGEMKFNWNGVNYTFYDDSLVLMMNFDNISTLGENDTYAVDVSKYGNNGTVTDAIFNSTGGKYGGAFEFDGAGDYVDVGYSQNFNWTDTNALTVSAWMKVNAFTAAAMESICQYNTGGRMWEMYFWTTTGNFKVYHNGSATNSTVSSLGSFSTNTWYHVVGVWNGTATMLYVDGTLADSDIATNGNSIYDTNTDLTIGSTDQIGSPFNGTIDEVRIWNRSLSANEIKKFYYNNLYKYDVNKWSLYINESDLNIDSNTYFAAASNSSGNENSTETRTITLLFKTTDYYDNRKMTVIWTGDDFGMGDINKHVNASNYAQSKKVVFSPAVVTGSMSSSEWEALQTEVDEGFVSPVSHSVNHEAVPYTNTTLEVCDSQLHIKGNLTLPWQNQFNGLGYLVGWVEPGGQSDSAVRDNLSACNYLSDRTVSTSLSSWASWNSSDGLYNRYGVTVNGDSDNLATLNNSFDTVYSDSGIYHLLIHPASHNWTETDKIPQHLSHIGNRTDVWYVGWGQLYMYHYLEDRIKPTVNITTRNNQMITARINASRTERNKYGLSYPVTYAFAVPSDWSNAYVYYKNTSSDDYTAMTEKTSTDFFNGIDAYRTNLSENGVYVSKSLPQEYNEFYLKIVPSLLAPTISFSCSPTTVTTGETITCSCSATDASDSNPTISYTVNPSTSSTGTFTTTCTATDDTGNSASSSISYTVSSSGGGGTPSFYPTESNLQEGYSKQLYTNWKLKFDIKNESHQLKLNSFNAINKTATITIFSDPQTKILSIGEEWKVNLDNNSYYDLLVRLNKVTVIGANIFIQEINKEIESEIVNEDEAPPEDKVPEEISETNWFLIAGEIVFVLLIVALFFGRKYFKKK